MTWVAGVDGCPAGWFVVLRDTTSTCTRHKLLRHIPEIFDLPEKPQIIAVDIPIGLLSEARRGGRECDRLARALLGKRGCCVFSPPTRPALRHSNYPQAHAENRRSSVEKIGISKQCFGLFPKLREVDQCIDAKKQECVCEVHPELCFFEMRGRHPMSHGKKSKDGLRERKKLLVREGFGSVIEQATAGILRREVAQDDILDGCAACWTAERILGGDAIAGPEVAELDSKGLRMQIWR